MIKSVYVRQNLHVFSTFYSNGFRIVVTLSVCYYFNWRFHSFRVRSELQQVKQVPTHRGNMSNNTSSIGKPLYFDATIRLNVQAIAELVPVALLITIANGLVLVLFSRRKQLRTAPNYVLFSLAICDFTSGVINIPLLIIVAFTPVITSLELQFYLNILVSVLNNLTAISTCYHILVATTEKYMSIIWPVTHRLISRKTVATVLGVVWVLSIIVAFLPFAWVNMKDSDTKDKLQLGHVIFCLVAVFLLPYSFMIYAFVVIFKWISTQGKTRSQPLSKQHLTRQASLEKRCLILFASMATIYLVCWLPWYILMLLFNVYAKRNRLQIPAHVFVLFRYATSIINPALYTFFRRDFRTALKSLLRKRRPHSPLLERCSESNKLAVNMSDETAENVV